MHCVYEDFDFVSKILTAVALHELACTTGTRLGAECGDCGGAVNKTRCLKLLTLDVVLCKKKNTLVP